VLNVKQGSCEYQLLKSFGPTRPGNRIQVYRLRGRRFNHLSENVSVRLESYFLILILPNLIKQPITKAHQSSLLQCFMQWV